jgi:hypothetical protein
MKAAVRGFVGNGRGFLRNGMVVLAACAAVLMAGCSSAGAPAATAAKNLYVVQNAYANSTENDAVLVFSAQSTGAATPSATLMLPTNFVAFSLAATATGELYVGGEMADADHGEILVYAAGASGAATPTATLVGGGTGTFTFPDFMALDAAGKLYVASDDGTVESFAAGATSAAAPTQYLTYGTTHIQYPEGMGVDTSGEIFVVSYAEQSIMVFGAGASGAAAPVRTITASSTGAFDYLWGMVVDPAGDVIVSNYNPADNPFGSVAGSPVGFGGEKRLGWGSRRRTDARPKDDPGPLLPTSLIEFAAGATGSPTPMRVISGSSTTINEPDALGMDAVSNVYYQDYENGALTVMMFPVAATGNVAPAVTMTSTAFTRSYSGQMVAY